MHVNWYEPSKKSQCRAVNIVHTHTHTHTYESLRGSDEMAPLNIHMTGFTPLMNSNVIVPPCVCELECTCETLK